MATGSPMGNTSYCLHAESHCVLPLGKVLASLLRGGSHGWLVCWWRGQIRPHRGRPTGCPALPGTRFRAPSLWLPTCIGGMSGLWVGRGLHRALRCSSSPLPLLLWIHPDSSSLPEGLQGLAPCAGRQRSSGPEQAAPPGLPSELMGEAPPRASWPPASSPEPCQGRVGAASPGSPPPAVPHLACPPPTLSTLPASRGLDPGPQDWLRPQSALGLWLPGTPGCTCLGLFHGGA